MFTKRPSYRHHYTLLVVAHDGQTTEVKFSHQLPAWRNFNRLARWIGKEGHDIKALRLIRDDGYDAFIGE